eukprot:scaffold45662_cov73-Cyclotella_meneghiniana.AAC.6
MKSVIIASLIASAAAFAPAQVGRSSTSVALDISGELGAQAPLGAFDPLNIMGDADQAKFDTWREIEIVHGRVAMLAVSGYLTTAAGIRFPGAEDVPGGFAAVNWLMSTDEGHLILPQMWTTFLVATIINRDASEVTGVKPAFPGDYRNGKLDFGWDKFDDKTKQRKRAIELNNGRAAQMGILGLMVHDIMGNTGDLFLK